MTKEDRRKYRRNYYLKNKKKEKKHMRAYRLKHAEEIKTYIMKWMENHPIEMMNGLRKRRYGISPEEYYLRVRKQKNRCAICGEKETQINPKLKKIRELSVDHDHITGAIRDLLCGRCNRGLGMFFDDVSLLLKAVQYLKRHKRNN